MDPQAVSDITRRNSDRQVEELIAELAQQYLDDRRRGNVPDIDSYAHRYPEHAELIRGTLSALQMMQSLDGSFADAWSREAEHAAFPGVLGDYAILRELGRGGMGVVYEAEQRSLNRRVALKVLPFAAMLNERSLQRFRNEVTAAAQLDHPHIVPVYGTGFEQGVHHYAMRLVEGVTLAEVIEQLRLQRDRNLPFPDSIKLTTSELARERQESGRTSSPEQGTSQPAAELQETRNSGDTVRSSAPGWNRPQQRLSYFRGIAELGASMAEALHHAHQQGIVHRDVKPSNILLEAGGHPWLADFGLAQLESDAAVTLTGELLGTARYMSPEQVRGDRVILDHRTDIYSLGVTLYELLALEPPFRSDQRQDLFRRIINEQPKSPARVNPAVPADLATIVLKTLEKNPDDRYASAFALADDLKRFVRNEPIAARPASLLNRASKWVSRHSTLALVVATAMLIVLGLSIAMSVMVTGYYTSERSARQRADELYQSNLVLSLQAREAVDQYVATVRNDALLSNPDARSLRNELLSHARTYYEALVKQLKESGSRLELARALLDLQGLVAESVGLQESVAVLQEVISILSEPGIESEDPPAVRALLRNAYNDLAVDYNHLGDRSRCLANMQSAVDLAREVVQEDPDNPEQRETLAIFLVNRMALVDADAEEKVAWGKEGIEILEGLLVADPENREISERLAWALSNLGRAALYADPDVAEPALQRAARLLAELRASAPDSPDLLATTAQTGRSLGELYMNAGNHSEGSSYYKDAEVHAERLVRLRPHVWKHRRLLGRIRKALGDYYTLVQGNNSQALVYFDKSADSLRGIGLDDPENAQIKSELAVSLTRLGSMLAANEKLPEAGARLRDSLDLSRQLIELDSANGSWRSDALLTLGLLVLVETHAGDPDAAMAILESHRGLIPEVGSIDPGDLQAIFTVGRLKSHEAELLYHRQDLEPACRLFASAIDDFSIQSRNWPAKSGIDISASGAISGTLDCLIELGRYGEALAEEKRISAEFRNAEPLAAIANGYLKILECCEPDELARYGTDGDDLVRRVELHAAESIRLVQASNQYVIVEPTIRRLCRRQLPDPLATEVLEVTQAKAAEGVALESITLAQACLRAGEAAECLEHLDQSGSTLLTLAVRCVAEARLNRVAEAALSLQQARNLASERGYLEREQKTWLREAERLMARLNVTSGF
jgi:serine/threonine protein kinase/tetratricopeptide (TPR) repeat protein